MHIKTILNLLQKHKGFVYGDECLLEEDGKKRLDSNDGPKSSQDWIFLNPEGLCGEGKTYPSSYFMDSATLFDVERYHRGEAFGNAEKRG